MKAFEILSKIDTKEKRIKCRYGDMEFYVDFDDVDHSRVKACLLVMQDLLERKNPELEPVYIASLKDSICKGWDDLCDYEKEEFHNDKNYYIFCRMKELNLLED